MMRACGRCRDDRTAANLTTVGDELVCPECLYKAAQHAWSHQAPAVPNAVARG